MIFNLTCWLLVAACLAACAASEEDALHPSSTRPQPKPLATGNEATVRGVVTDNVHDYVLDGPGYLYLDTSRGRLTVTYAAPRGTPCPNREATKAGMAAAPGDEIEVFARATGTDALSTCPDPRFYIRRAAD